MPNGRRVARRFSPDHTLAAVAAFCIVEEPEAATGRPFQLAKVGIGEHFSFSKESSIAIMEVCCPHACHSIVGHWSHPSPVACSQCIIITDPAAVWNSPGLLQDGPASFPKSAKLLAVE